MHNWRSCEGCTANEALEGPLDQHKVYSYHADRGLKAITGQFRGEFCSLMSTIGRRSLYSSE